MRIVGASIQSKVGRLCLFGIAVMLQLVFINVVSAQSQVDFTAKEIAAIGAQGSWPGSIPPDPGNNLSEFVWAQELGKYLFFSEMLSANQAISCGTCHQPDSGFSDNRPVAVGLKQGVRNTQGLLDVGLHRWFGWGGGTDSLWAASIRPLLAASEMGNDVATLANTLRADAHVKTAVQKHLLNSDFRITSANKSLIEANAYDDALVTSLSDEDVMVFAAKSIAAYMRTLRSKPTAFDRFRNALVNEDLQAQLKYSESAKRGLKIFIGDANCRTCHFGPNFSNEEFHDTGRGFFTSVGKVDPGRYAGIKRVKKDPFNLLGKHSTGDSSVQLKTSRVKLGQVNWGQWRTPSLRNLQLTAPYMHDGSLKTLREVVDAYADIDIERLHSQGESLLKPLDLDDDQRNDLVNFLLSLSVEK